MRRSAGANNLLDLESVVMAQLIVLVVGVSWAFGGNADWVRTPISIWGSLGFFITLAILIWPRLRHSAYPGTLHWTLPVLALNGFVALSCTNPGLRLITIGGDTFFLPVPTNWWVPSAARPEIALRALWLFDGIYFSCLNGALVLRRRRTIRILLAVVVGNALALSIFGIAQNLSGATGIYFGLVRSPQEHFFASFVYANHWGAFVVLMIGACIGLILRYSFGSHGEGFFRGPAFAGTIAALTMGISVPLSGSRACTFLLVLMLLIAGLHGTPRISRALRFSGLSSAFSLAAIAVAAGLALGTIWYVAGNVIEARASKTREQVSEMISQGSIGSRSILYHDTLRMARVRPVFGWGMGSFPTVFTLYNSQESKIDHLPVIYHDAHSDWLQSLAEVGWVGTLLIAMAVGLPLRAIRRSNFSSISYFLLTGCVLTLAYAWVEFPFGNVSVVLSWWLCFFCAVQYTRLSSTRSKESQPTG
jgi:O-antigen ligase